MRIAFFDCFSGAAGDMIVGACLDAGADEARLRQALMGLKLDGVDIHIEKVVKKGIAATHFKPLIHGYAEGEAHGHSHEGHGHSHGHRHEKKESAGHEHGVHRNLPMIRGLIDAASLSERVKGQTVGIFERLAQAEAAVHGTTVEAIHFHEVGADDAIMDIVGACVGLELLGVEAIYVSELATGSGTVKCAHGVMPVPAPATVELIKGVPIYSGPVKSELLTPTGAAILTTLGAGFGPMPAMCIEGSGYGAGTRDYAGLANVVRLILGESEPQGNAVETVTVLEATLDDATGEMVGHAIGVLLERGALDAVAIPVVMKKGRPGVVLQVLCMAEKVAGLEAVLFEETTTFGVRRHGCSRTILARESVAVETVYGPVAVKVGRRSGEVLTVSPEYEDCRRAAAAGGVSLRKVYEAVLESYARKTGQC